MRLYTARYKERSCVVLECNGWENFNIYRIVQDTILLGEKRPNFKRLEDGTVRYRFSKKYLLILANTFTQAEQSPAIQRILSKQHNKVIFGSSEIPEDIEIPGFSGTLYPFQVAGVQLLTNNNNFFLLDEMGLGKSLMTLAAAAHLDSFPILVICPNSVKFAWRNEVEKWFPMITPTVIGGTHGQRVTQLNSQADVYIINYECLRLHSELQKREWPLVILDEYHRLRNPSTKQTKATLKISAHRKWLLSGTPLLNGRLEEYWAPLHYLFPEKFPNAWLFRKRYCILFDRWIVGYKNVGELRTFLYKHSLRRRKEQVLKDLPPVTYNIRYVELTAEQRKQYKMAKEELLIWLEDGTPKTINHIFSQMVRLKQICFSPELYEGSKTSTKIKELKEVVEELTMNGEKAIIFSQWSKATRILERELKEYGIAYVDGSVPAKKRELEIHRFQNDPDTRLYIGTIGANKEGITLTAASYVIFTDLSWVPAENDQAIARAHRIGQERAVNVIELRAQDSIEEKIAKRLEEKTKMNTMMTERDGGTALPKITIESIKDLLK